MSVAFLTGTTTNLGSSGGGTTLTNSFNSGSTGSDRLLLVSISMTGSNPSSVTYAGVSMGNHATGGNQTMWRLVNPATGANNLVLTVGTSNSAQISPAVFTGVDQTTPLGSQVTATGTSNSPSSGSVTCPTDGMVYGGLQAGYSTSPGTVTAGSGTTLNGWVRSGSNGWRKAGGYRSNTGTISFNPTNSPAWGVQAVPINPSVSFTAKLPELHLQAVQRSVL